MKKGRNLLVSNGITFRWFGGTFNNRFKGRRTLFLTQSFLGISRIRHGGKSKDKMLFKREVQRFFFFSTINNKQQGRLLFKEIALSLIGMDFEKKK
jgi:putative SOS response-associated peptidase YedK